MRELTCFNRHVSMDEYIVHERVTRGTETSKYPEEEKINNDFLSSGERTGKRPNRSPRGSGLWICDMVRQSLEEEDWNVPPKRVKAPYSKG